jgi:predicted MFS family arabinose efflux permease
LRGHPPTGKSAQILAYVLATIPAIIALALLQAWNPTLIIILGLFIFGIVFAINSAVHSYLILAYSADDKVALNVGFYYMANAGGRLTGTVLSGLLYQLYGLIACLWISASFIFIAGLLSTKLKNRV